MAWTLTSLAFLLGAGIPVQVFFLAERGPVGGDLLCEAPLQGYLLYVWHCSLISPLLQLGNTLVLLLLRVKLQRLRKLLVCPGSHNLEVAARLEDGGTRAWAVASPPPTGHWEFFLEASQNQELWDGIHLARVAQTKLNSINMLSCTYF